MDYTICLVLLSVFSLPVNCDQSVAYDTDPVLSHHSQSSKSIEVQPGSQPHQPNQAIFIPPSIHGHNVPTGPLEHASMGTHTHATNDQNLRPGSIRNTAESHAFAPLSVSAHDQPAENIQSQQNRPPHIQYTLNEQQLMADAAGLGKLPAGETPGIHASPAPSDHHQRVIQEMVEGHYPQASFRKIDTANKMPKDEVQANQHLYQNQKRDMQSSQQLYVDKDSSFEPFSIHSPVKMDIPRSANPLPPGQHPPSFQNDNLQAQPQYAFDPIERRQRPNSHLPTINEKADDFISLTMVIHPAIKQCLYYSPSSDFIIDYQVIRGGNLDLGLYVRDPDGEPVAVRHPSPEATLPIRVPQYFVLRPYAICLDNRKSSYAEKHVAVSVDLDINWDNPSAPELAAIENLRRRTYVNAQIEAEDANYRETWKTISTHLEGLFARMRRIAHLQQKSDNFASVDQGLMEANLYRVASGSIVQMVVMLSVASAQILLIRALFDPTSRLYRFWFGKRSLVSTRC